MKRTRIDLRGFSYSVSAVGFSKPKSGKPLEKGNYCTASNPVGKFRAGLRMANLWYENLKLIIDDLGIREVEGYIWEWRHPSGDLASYFVLTDDRIPHEYTNPELCFTGYARPPDEMVEQMLEKARGKTDDKGMAMSSVQEAYDRGWEVAQAPTMLAEEHVNHKDHNPYDVITERDAWEAFARGFNQARQGKVNLNG